MFMLFSFSRSQFRIDCEIKLGDTWHLVITEVGQQLGPFGASGVEGLGLHELDVDDGEVDEGPQLRIVVDGLHAVDEGQQKVPDLLLVAVEELHVHVVGRLEGIRLY